MPTRASRLLADVAPMPFPARSRAVAGVARQLAGSAELDDLLADLDGADVYEQRLALLMARAAGHAAYVRRCLGSPHTALIVPALAAAVRMDLPADVFVERLPSLPKALRRALYRVVKAHGTTQLTDPLLTVVAEHFGEHEAAAILPACSGAVVARELPALGFALTGWAMIGRRHPQVLLDHVDADLAATAESTWPEFVGRVGSGLAAAAPADPGRVLDVLQRCARTVSLNGPLRRVLRALARHDPLRVVGIMLTPGRRESLAGGRSLWRELSHLDDHTLVRLARAHGADATRFLHALPPARRPAVYRGLVGDRDPLLSGFTPEILDELPGTARHDEARRLLARRNVSADPPTRLAVAARLPWSEAEPVLREAIRRPGGADRAAAYPLYVLGAAGTRDRAAVEAMVGTLTRLANDQDPVRAAAVGALADVPPWMFTPASAAGLGALIQSALQARDSSWTTQRAVRRLGDRLIRDGASSGRPALIDAGLTAMYVAGNQLGRLSLYGLDESLPRGAEQQIFAALRPRIVADLRVGRYGVPLALATGLGRRAWLVLELQDIVDQARAAKDDGVVQQAIALWLAPPRTRDERVDRVLKGDRSTIVVPVVAHTVAARRTDLLDDLLARPLHGRFLKRGVRHVPAFGNFSDRWHPRQVTAYRDLLRRLAVSTRASTYERAGAVRSLARLPGTADLVRHFAADPERQVVEAALTAMAWTDEPAAALPHLLARADGDDAHVALAAATRCVRFVPPDQLADPLRMTLDTGKITARKEAVRLIAEHQVPGAAALLAAAQARPNQHRDVRRAIVSAGRWLLDDETTWRLLEQSARTDDAATAILELSVDAIAPRHRARYAGLVRTVAGSAQPDTALLALRALPRWTRWESGASTSMLVAATTDLDNATTWRAALDALVAAGRWSQDPAGVLDAAARLLRIHDADDATDRFDAATDRDRPARQRLDALADALRAHSRDAPELREVMGKLIDVVTPHPDCRDVAVRLAADAVTWERSGSVLEQLRRVIGLCERPTLSFVAAERLQAGFTRVSQLLEPAPVLALTRALVAEPSAAAALVAVAVVEVGGRDAGWPAEWRALLRGLRRSADPDVRLAAAGVSTSRE